MSAPRRQRGYRLSTILLVIFVIIVDQLSLSDTLMIGGRTASFISRRRRSERPPRAANKKRMIIGTSVDDVGETESRSNQRHRLPYQLVRHLRNADKRMSQDQGQNDDDNDISSDEIVQGHVEVSKDDELDQERLENAKVTYGEGSRSRDQLDNYVSLDSRGDFELFWDVDSVTETILFRLVANVNKDDLLAFGFSAYGEPQDADFCVMWTNFHGRHFFQVSRPTASSRTKPELVIGHHLENIVIGSYNRMNLKCYCNSSAKKMKFSNTPNSNNVSTNKFEIDGQPEIAMWPTKPEVLISPTVRQISCCVSSLFP